MIGAWNTKSCRSRRASRANHNRVSGMSLGDGHGGNEKDEAMATILNVSITAPGAFYGQPFMPIDPKTRFVPQNNNVECVFSYGSGGTSVDVFLQTSHDGGTWRDSVRWGQFATSSTRAIWRVNAADSVLDFDQQSTAPSLSWWRIKYVVAGTYAGNTNLRINVISADLVQAGPF